MGNLMNSNIYPLISSEALTILDKAGIMVFQHLDGHSFADGAYSQTDYNLMVKWIDETLAVLPSISGFWIDPSINVDSSSFGSFYDNLISYIHSQGKLAHINLASSAIWGNKSPIIQKIENDADGIVIENSWIYLTPEIANLHPGKWIANCWGGAYSEHINPPVSWSYIENSTATAWNNGVDFFCGNPTYVENWDFVSHASDVSNYFNIIYNHPEQIPAMSSAGSSATTFPNSFPGLSLILWLLLAFAFGIGLWVIIKAKKR